MMMPPRFVRVLVACSAVAAAVGCSTTTVGSESADPGPAGATASSFVADYCTLFAPCCDGAGRARDAERCQAGFANVAAAPNYDVAKGTACLAELHAAKDFCDYAANSPHAPSCRAVFTQSGAKQLGQACATEAECAASPEGWVSCVSGEHAGAQTRTCQLRLVGTEGDGPCVATVDENGPLLASYGAFDGPPVPRGYTCNLDDGLRCDAATKKCVRSPDIGGPCEHPLSFDECPKNAYCTYAQKLDAGVNAYECVERTATGAACDTKATLGDPCAKDAFCDPSANACVPRAVDGAPCTSNVACSSSLCVNGLCAKLITLDLSRVCGAKN